MEFMGAHYTNMYQKVALILGKPECFFFFFGHSLFMAILVIHLETMFFSLLGLLACDLEE